MNRGAGSRVVPGGPAAPDSLEQSGSSAWRLSLACSRLFVYLCVNAWFKVFEIVLIRSCRSGGIGWLVT